MRIDDPRLPVDHVHVYDAHEGPALPARQQAPGVPIAGPRMPRHGSQAPNPGQGTPRAIGAPRAILAPAIAIPGPIYIHVLLDTHVLRTHPRRKVSYPRT
jgi:hypothetical protein